MSRARKALPKHLPGWSGPNFDPIPNGRSYVPQLVIVPPNITRTMTAKNEYVSGSSTWKREGGIWHCVAADKPLKFLLQMDPLSAKFDLIKRGFNWEWKSVEGCS